LLHEQALHPTEAAGTGMVTAWFMGSLDTNPFMKETLAHMHLACPSPSPSSPKG